MNINFKKLAKSIAIPLLIGAAAGFLTKSGMDTFQTLNQPPLTPPPIVFPIVWTILYALMGISFYLVSTNSPSPEEFAQARATYLVQFVLNFLWPFFFFNFGWYLFSFFWLIALWFTVLIMIKQFADISKAAAWLNVPYLIWLTFAGYLNLGVWWLNR